MWPLAGRPPSAGDSLAWGAGLSQAALKRRSATYFRSWGWATDDRRSLTYAMVIRKDGFEAMLSFVAPDAHLGVALLFDMSAVARDLGTLPMLWIASVPVEAHYGAGAAERGIFLAHYGSLPALCAHVPGLGDLASYFASRDGPAPSRPASGT